MLLIVSAPALALAKVALPLKFTMSPLMAFETFNRLAAALALPSYTRVAPLLAATAMTKGVTVRLPLT